jgi:hypothetical protein
MLRRRLASLSALAVRALSIIAIVGACACGKSESDGASASRSTPGVSPAEAGAARTVTMTPAPATGAVDVLVRTALAAASAAGQTLVVYVGATWCEPCRYFHHAVDDGELGSSLEGLTLLEFDLDRDRERLEAAGYRSSYIPLFALPGADGRASGRQVEGGIKGDAAVGFMVPRLRGLLGR